MEENSKLLVGIMFLMIMILLATTSYYYLMQIEYKKLFFDTYEEYSRYVNEKYQNDKYGVSNFPKMAGGC